jgi:hypothetical protein
MGHWPSVLARIRDPRRTGVPSITRRGGGTQMARPVVASNSGARPALWNASALLRAAEPANHPAGGRVADARVWAILGCAMNRRPCRRSEAPVAWAPQGVCVHHGPETQCRPAGSGRDRPATDRAARRPDRPQLLPCLRHRAHPTPHPGRQERRPLPCRLQADREEGDRGRRPGDQQPQPEEIPCACACGGRYTRFTRTWSGRPVSPVLVHSVGASSTTIGRVGGCTIAPATLDLGHNRAAQRDFVAALRSGRRGR